MLLHWRVIVPVLLLGTCAAQPSPGPPFIGDMMSSHPDYMDYPDYGVSSQPDASVPPSYYTDYGVPSQPDASAPPPSFTGDMMSAYPEGTAPPDYTDYGISSQPEGTAPPDYTDYGVSSQPEPVSTTMKSKGTMETTTTHRMHSTTGIPSNSSFPPGTMNQTQPPDGSLLKAPVERVRQKQFQIRNSINDFYKYEYDGLNTFIADGGSDMYDRGNQITINRLQNIEYERYYSSHDEYEFFSSKGWPFFGLMYVNNTNYNRSSFSIQITGDAGADGGGYKVYFDSSASMNGIDVKYTVTEVYGAGDPTICEVFFATSDSGYGSLTYFEPLRTSGTNALDSGIYLRNYPRNIWIGYMLLSKSDGVYITQYEVDRAVTLMVSAVFGFDEIPFDFHTSPTVVPTTTTPHYQKYSYEGFIQSTCNQYRYYNQNETMCSGTPTLVKLVVEMPSGLGYNTTTTGAIMSCSENDTICYEGCNDTRELVGDLKVLDCETRCCQYSYCNAPNYHYYYPDYWYPGNYTPPNVTLPESALPDVNVEVLPNCMFKSLASQLSTCIDEIFDSWPFNSPPQCKSKLFSAYTCVMNKIGECTTNDLFSAAMLRFPPFTNLNVATIYLQQSNVLDLLCSAPTDNIFNASFQFWGNGPYSYNYSLGISQIPTPINIGNPYCDRFIMDSLIDWGMEYLIVLKSSMSRTEMCRSLKGLINKVLDAAENRCNLDMIAHEFPCDSVLRNQIRALIVQAKAMIPKLAPDYCEGVDPPTEPEHPDDLPFLPSCTLRETIKSLWSCESVFSKDAPYSDRNICGSNVNRLLHCIANRLSACAEGNGMNVFDIFGPYFRFEDIITGIRYFATQPPSGCGNHGQGNYGYGGPGHGGYGYTTPGYGSPTYSSFGYGGGGYGGPGYGGPGYSGPGYGGPGYGGPGYGPGYGPGHGGYYGPMPDIRDMICTGMPISAHSLDFVLKYALGICEPNSTYPIAQKIVQAYYDYLGARNSADVCKAFRSARDAISDALNNQCDISFLKYFLPIGSPIRQSFTSAVHIVLDVLSKLEISVCPQAPTPPGNDTFTVTKWLKSYIRWRSYSLPKWQAGFDKWRSENGQVDTIEMPKCYDLTGITCRNPDMKTCDSDYYGCGFCSCLDHKYKGLTKMVMQPWLDDYNNWEAFQSMWEEEYSEWENDNDA